MSHYRQYKPRKQCKHCEYYRSKQPHSRCKHPSNMTSNWLGTVYIKRPDHMNWNGKCLNYMEDSDQLRDREGVKK